MVARPSNDRTERWPTQVSSLRRFEWAFYLENTMTNDEIRKEIEDAKFFLDEALKALETNDVDSMLGELENAHIALEDVANSFDEEDYE